MKHIAIALMVAMCLIGCGLKEKENTEELVKLYEDGNVTFYVATPSGVIYIATDSEPVIYIDENGLAKSIFEDNELHR